MELAIQLNSSDQTVRDNTIEHLKDFNSQSLSTRAKKRRTTSFNDACYQKSFQSVRQ